MDKHTEVVTKSVSNVRKALLKPHIRPPMKKHYEDFSVGKDSKHINFTCVAMIVTIIYGLYLHGQGMTFVMMLFRLVIVSGSVSIVYFAVHLIEDWKKSKRGIAVVNEDEDPHAEWQTHYYKPLRKDIETMNKEFPEFKFRLNDMGEVFFEGTSEFKTKIFDELVSEKLAKEK